MAVLVDTANADGTSVTAVSTRTSGASISVVAIGHMVTESVASNGYM